MIIKTLNNKSAQTFKLQILIGLIGLLASACSGIEHPHAVLLDHHGKSGDISHTAETRIVHVLNTDAGYEFCAEAVPDVGESQESEDSINIHFLNFFHDTETSDAMEETTEDLALVGRTGYILLARELGYRLCESGLGMNWSFEEYFKLYQANAGLIKKIGKVEASKSTYSFKVLEKDTNTIGMSMQQSSVIKQLTTAQRIKNAQQLRNLIHPPDPNLNLNLNNPNRTP